MKTNNDQIKLAIIGCGAIAMQSYLPAAAVLPNISVTHLVDSDLDRAKESARVFHVPEVTADYRDTIGKVDAVVVATPPASHRDISIDCMNNGLHVLCEKPLAPTVEQAVEMVEAATRNGTHFAVGMVRRLSWSARLLKKMISSGMLGKMRSFDIEEGWEFNWPLRTPHLFQNESARGVIEDTGPHMIDLLLWFLGATRVDVLSCEGDSRGGIEANSVMALSVQTSTSQCTGRIELSFSRRLRNTMQFIGERGCIEAETVGADKIFFYPDGFTSPRVDINPGLPIQKKRNEEFVHQLSNFVASLSGGAIQYVPAAEAVPVLSTIESCYHIMTASAQPWEVLHLETYFGSAAQ
jgi:predicted dehydrogenase